jgi:bacterioferritin
MLLLPLLSSTYLEIVISTEAAHGLIVSSAVEKFAVAAHFGFASSLPHPRIRKNPVLLKGHGFQPCRKDSVSQPAILHSQTPTHIPASHSEQSTGETMPTPKETASLTREKLIDLLNEDLAREFQAIIAYVNYSQVLKGAAYMNIAAELAVHATEELAHAITLSNQIDYLGGMPTTVPKPVKTSEKAEDMLRFDLDNENETIRQYRRRIKQCDELGEFATAEQIRQILLQEQDHQIALATALGIDVPNVGIAD